MRQGKTIVYHTTATTSFYIYDFDLNVDHRAGVIQPQHSPENFAARER